jgi:hypothetical protein
MNNSRVLWLANYIPSGTIRAALLLTLACTGCQPEAPKGGVPAPKVEEPDAPKGDAIADPVLREAREQVDAVLTDMLAGKHDQDEFLGRIATKLRGYQSWSIKSQQVVREGAVEFRGILIGPGGRARFNLHYVKQKNGKWAIGAFVGPNPE